MNDPSGREARKHRVRERIANLVATAPSLHARFMALRSFGTQVRIREYHLTNACNIRCKGCWFFSYGHDQGRREEKSLAAWEAFAAQQRQDRVNTALLIGGEPTLFLERIYAFVKAMRHVTISTNGLRKLPSDERFGQVAMLVSVFGGGPLDDDLRAIKPSGRPFRGLFNGSLRRWSSVRSGSFHA